VTAIKHRVGRIATTDIGALAIHRGLAGWSLCPAGPQEFWLRVPPEDEGVFRKLPLLGRWSADAEGSLVREGRRVPEAMLPAEGWQTVATYLTVGPPQRSAPGMPPPAVAFQLEVDSADHPAAALLCDGENFAAWVETAFARRLDRLRFACCNDGRLFVAGLPLPAIPGAGFHQLGRLWLPCGYRLPDHVWPELIEEMLVPGRNRMAVLHPDGSHEELDEENLVPASRAAVRRSMHARPMIH
jgi:hypothetical protein